ncbi:MAG: single-stranded DNA-binding protein [Aurantimicrobium sp.]|uniref:single-stranded DNA-binding protein n=1 Tax=Aurantimicrobium sp. TaxID=1930784 RepID=UPI002FC9E08C
MTDNITLTGLVATTPRHLTTSEGLAITSFRLASSQRRFDRAANRWVDGDTNWYTVSSFRALAENAATSVSKGDRVIVTGKLRIRDWENTDRSGTTVEVEAEALGHDLTWGIASYTRNSSSTEVTSVAEDDWGGIPDKDSDEEDLPLAAKSRKKVAA